VSECERWLLVLLLVGGSVDYQCLLRHFYWSACTRPGKWAVMYLYFGVSILIFLQFSIGCFDSVVYFVFISIVFGKLFKPYNVLCEVVLSGLFSLEIYRFLLWNPLNIFFILVFLLLELIVNHKGSSPWNSKIQVKVGKAWTSEKLEAY
jgi:hypothetical protein